MNNYSIYTSFTLRILINGLIHEVCGDTTPNSLGWTNWILLWILIHMKIKIRLGRASSWSKHGVRKKESSVWNGAPEMETLFGAVLALSLQLVKCMYLKWQLEYFIDSLTMKWCSLMMLNSAILLNMPYFRWYKKSLWFLTTWNLCRFKGWLWGRKSLVFRSNTLL